MEWMCGQGLRAGDGSRRGPCPRGGQGQPREGSRCSAAPAPGAKLGVKTVGREEGGREDAESRESFPHGHS